MIRFAPCKINLGLHIIEKRADGFHNLETVFYPVPWCDVVEAVPSDTLTFTTSGQQVPGNISDNLCIRAFELMKAKFALPPVALHLHKVLPTGAGLGGGSSDGAHTLRALNDIFSLGLSPADLLPFAAQLGSDCGFFLFDDPMLGTGRGEILSPAAVSLAGYYLVLIKPAIHVATAEAYRGISPRKPTQPLQETLHQPVARWRELLANDFEESVFKKFPEIESIKNKLYEHGAVYACMSGSGATVFGIFESPLDLSGHFPAADYWAGTLH
jgi:4-diphosphocytidyl-2-C-methyl-D-erythritol kinase